MLTKIKLKNYKSFKDININFSGKNNSPKKLIILYGENGSGKSNIINIFDTLTDSFQTMLLKKYFLEAMEKNSSSLSSETLQKLLSYADVSNIIKNTKTFDSDENMLIEITFNLNNKTGIYSIEFDNSTIVNEKLEYVITKNRSVFFNISSNNKSHLNEKIFSKEISTDLYLLIEKYWGKHSLMSLIYYKQDDLTDTYFENNINENMLAILKYFTSISYYIVENKNKWGSTIMSDVFLSSIAHGKIEKDRKYLIDRTEIAIKEILTNTYNDIKDVSYKIEETDSHLKYELIIHKLISGKIIEVPITNESCGTKNLINLIPFFLSTNTNYITGIDEIDNGLHDILFENIFNNLIKANKGQLIITTHNTSFINNYELKDNIYFICIDENGNKEIRALTDFGYRIQEKGNALAHYLNSEFNTRPWKNISLDFSSIYEKTCSKVEK